jgi:OmpA-OmpF porin, OOP family
MGDYNMFNSKSVLSVVVASVAGIVVATSANASDDGVYVGGQLGYGKVHTFDTNITRAAGGFKESQKDDGIAGRLFAGFQINPNFAVEAGYTKFSDATDKVSGSGVDAKMTLEAQAIDVSAKGIIPLQNGFSIYGKLGGAYLYEKADVKITAFGETDKAHESENQFYPTFGLGVNYDINKNVSTDLSWTRIQKVGNKDLESTDFFGLGLAYHFG